MSLLENWWRGRVQNATLPRGETARQTNKTHLPCGACAAAEWTSGWSTSKLRRSSELNGRAHESCLQKGDKQGFSIILRNIYIQQEIRDRGLTEREVQDDCDAQVSLRRSKFLELRRVMWGGQEPRHPPLTWHTLRSLGGKNEDGSFQDSDLNIRLEICGWEETRKMLLKASSVKPDDKRKRFIMVRAAALQ